MEPFLQIMPDRWLIFPTIVVGHPKCECCDQGPVILSFDWLCVSAGLAFNPPHNEA